MNRATTSCKILGVNIQLKGQRNSPTGCKEPVTLIVLSPFSKCWYKRLSHHQAIIQCPGAPSRDSRGAKLVQHHTLMWGHALCLGTHINMWWWWWWGLGHHVTVPLGHWPSTRPSKELRRHLRSFRVPCQYDPSHCTSPNIMNIAFPGMVWVPNIMRSEFEKKNQGHRSILSALPVQVLFSQINSLLQSCRFTLVTSPEELLPANFHYTQKWVVSKFSPFLALLHCLFHNTSTL